MYPIAMSNAAYRYSNKTIAEDIFADMHYNPAKLIIICDCF